MNERRINNPDSLRDFYRYRTPKEIKEVIKAFIVKYVHGDDIGIFKN